MIDAAGAIYVIGGASGTYYRDVWATTDGGADRSQQGTRRGTCYAPPWVYLLAHPRHP